MKRCPKCNSTYSDDTLSFCLSDGAALLEDSGEETVAFSKKDAGEMRIEIPKETVEIQSPAPVTTVEPAKKGFGGFLLGFLASILVIVLIGTGAAAIYFLLIPDKQTTVNNNSSSPTPDEEVESLKKKLSELEGKLNEDNNSDKPESATPKPSETLPPAPPTGPAIVNSPGDGFLAMRSNPNHKTGKLITKIPHGMQIRLDSCQRTRTKIGGKSGSWCTATYNGKTGWIFDAWVVR